MEDAPQPDEKSIGELFQRLAEDGRAYVDAEIGYYRTLVRAKLLDARASLLLGAAATALALAAAVALVVGLVLTLAPLVGPGLATLIVFLGMFAVSAVMAWLAWLKIKAVLGEKPKR